MHYPADIAQLPSGEWSVAFPDVPAANVNGLGSLDEAVEVAGLVLCVVLDAAVRKGEQVPTPSDCAPGQAAVHVPWSLASRLRELQDTRPADEFSAAPPGPASTGRPTSL